MILGVSQADGFALSMIVILGLGMSVVLGIALIVVRHSRHRDSEVDELIEELERDERAPQPAGESAAPSAEKPEPWERPGDWWKE